ncbi:MAG: N-acetylmuramoyl-L-alanine amidase [Weeksellaceae bacterium]|nr:N-acetylmuramoyl-L-alanine amidase [Weeksellaceae bacterium]
MQTITKTVRDTVYIKEIHQLENEQYVSAKIRGYEMNDEFYPAYGQDSRVKFLIMHYTALNNDKSLEVLSQREVSAHYVVNDLRDDVIHILVSEDQRSWHAGVSFWNGRNNLNDSSIGIEIVNQGFTENQGQMFFFEFPSYQIQKVGLLARNIIERHGIEPQNVLAHSDVAPGRKYDPGALFPWEELYREFGVGAWFEYHHYFEFLSQYPYEKQNQKEFITDVQNALKLYGYNISITGEWDEQTKKVIQAFQLHFRPANYNGTMDADTWAILRSLNLKYRTKV